MQKVPGSGAEVRHVIRSQQFDRDTLDRFWRMCDELGEMEESRRGTLGKLLQGRIMASLFYEPSTRTRMSFESAMLRLGGSVITTENAKKFSSAAKGESIEDSVRVIANYADVIVIRHGDDRGEEAGGPIHRAAMASPVPVINAGDGPFQHPTQGLLDTYAFRAEFGRIDGLNVALVGDLRNGRTVRSLAYMLSKYDGCKLYFVAPDHFQIKDDIVEHLDENGVAWEKTDSLHAVAPLVDGVYMTRIQWERLVEEERRILLQAGNPFCIDHEFMRLLRPEARIFHPLPRLDEIPTWVDADPRMAAFRQAKGGLLVRMGLLHCVVNKLLSFGPVQ